MTATQPPAWTPAPNPGFWSTGRIVALVLGVLLLLPGLGLLAGGGVLLWVDQSGRTDGFVLSDDARFSSDGYALASERIDLATGADWIPLSASLGTARLEVTGTQDVFIGIAPVSDAEAYLDGVQRTVVDDLGLDAEDSARQQLPGNAPATPPTDQDFWTEQASGPGLQLLSWNPEQGDWMLVIMNADGSAGVDIEARIGATVPALAGLAWGLLGAGLLLTVIGVLLLALSIRRRPSGPTAAPYGGGGIPAPRAGETSPIWGPPAEPGRPAGTTPGGSAG